MTPRSFLLSLRLLAAAGVLGVGLLASGAAVGDELPADQTGRLARLQGLTSELANRASDLAQHAIETLGIRYKYGSNQPEHGLDCSGLVQYVFKQAWGKDLPRTSAEISRVGERVDVNDLQPGDLVFYNTLRRGFSHVGIYLGDDKFIHAPSKGGRVRIESMNISYWKKRFNGARRISDGDDGTQ